MDIIIFLILIILVLIFLKDTKSIIIFIGLTDVILKLIHQIKLLINASDFTKLINKYVPSGVVQIINNNTEGIVTTLLVWGCVIIMIMFVWYLMKYLFRLR